MRVTVRVKPGASRTRVGGGEPTADGHLALVVRVAARAVEGKANAAVVTALADALGVRRREIEILHGHTARTKVVEIPDTAAATVERLTAEAS